MNQVFDADGRLKPEAFEVLYEIGNVGVGTAVMAIGNIRGMEIRISTPNVITVEKDIFPKIEYDPEQIVIGVTTEVSEALEGSILFLLSREFVRNTVYEMTEEYFSDEEMLVNEDSVSAIREMTNYMTAGYAKVIGTYLDLPVYISAPTVGMSRVENIVHKVMLELDARVDRIACVNTRFTIIDEHGEKTDEAGRVLIFPNEKSIERFITIMGE